MSDMATTDSMDNDSGERGCGMRIAGGVYLETKLSKNGNGRPLTDYLLCPPQVIDTQAMGISPVGVTLIERDGVTHVFDWVGSSNYLNVADYVEEAQRMGISRRISKATDFSKLSSRSLLFLVHARAHIDNCEEYFMPTTFPCAVAGEQHEAASEEMCPAYFWRDLEPGTAESGEFGTVRRMPSFTYHGTERPSHVRPIYQPAVFMVIPIGQITVIEDQDGGSHEQAYEKARAAGIAVEIEPV